MRRPALLIAAGTAAFLAFLVAFLPASVLLRFVPPEVGLSQVTGTVWRGGAGSVTVRGQSLGSLRWTSRPWRLALLQLDYAVELRPTGGQVDMDVILGGGRLELSQIKGGFPLTAIEGLLAPLVVIGAAELDIASIELDAGLLRSASGTVTVRNLAAGRGGNIRYGSFELTLGEGAVGGESIPCRLRDLGEGPMRVRATLDLKPDWSYLLSGDVAAGPDASAALLRDLTMLGPPDSLGRRPFTIEGSL
jgi:general secretion pathway protein N